MSAAWRPSLTLADARRRHRRSRARASAARRCCARPGTDRSALRAAPLGVYCRASPTRATSARSCAPRRRSAPPGSSSAPGLGRPFQPKAVRASMGSTFALPLSRASRPPTSPRASASPRPASCAHGGAPLADADLPRPAVLCVGAERAGLAPGLALIPTADDRAVPARTRDGVGRPVTIPPAAAGRRSRSTSPPPAPSPLDEVVRRGRAPRPPAGRRLG